MILSYVEWNLTRNQFCDLRNSSKSFYYHITYFIPLLLGVGKIETDQQLNNGWHKVHITRNDQSVKMNTEDADGESMSLIDFTLRR